MQVLLQEVPFFQLKDTGGCEVGYNIVFLQYVIQQNLHYSVIRSRCLYTAQQKRRKTTRGGGYIAKFMVSIA